MIKSKRAAILFSCFLFAVTMSPVLENWKPAPKDSFPFSYYPMFSKKRDRIYTMKYFVGYDSEQESIKIPYNVIGSGGFNQVRRQINKKCREGKTASLTRKVAKRIGTSKNTTMHNIVCVELVEGRYDLHQFFLTKEKAISETVLEAQNISRP